MHQKVTTFAQVLPLVLITFLGCAKRPSAEETVSTPAAGGTSKTVALVSEASARSPKKATKLPTADLPILDRYRSAKSYSDRATLKLTHYLDDGRREESLTQIVTRFDSPNRIHLLVSSEDNLVDIVCDGKQITAKIVDPITENFNGQVVVRSAPEKLSMASLYEVTELMDPISPNEMLSALLGVPAGLDVLPFSLLVNEGKLTELVSSQVPHASLGDMKLPATGEACEVIEAHAEEGKYRFWIVDNTLRRMEFPPLTQNLLPGVRQMALVVELDDITFAAADSDFLVNDEGTRVRHFVLPPVPPATDQLGKALANLTFQNRKDEVVRVANEDGQITVLVWFRNRPESQMVLESIEQVRRRNRSDRVRFAAVSAEPDATYELLQDWSVETAWLQDRLAEGREQLGIERAPTVVVLGPKNSIQYFEIGANPNIGADVAAVIQRLLAGQDVAAATQALAAETARAYERLLARARVDGDGWVEELEAELPKSKQPERLSLTKLWTNDEIKEPGNFLIVPGKRKQILVVDGWKQLAMLGLDGKITRRIDLELPAEEGISILRAGSNGRDRALFAAASRGGRQAFVFDFAGKKQTQYPASPNQEYLISDLIVHDIDQKDDPELIVGWQGSGGVHGVGLDGKHHWSNQATPGVISVSAVKDESSGSERRPILTAGESGLLFLVDENGRTLREVRLDRVVHQLSTWPGNARGFETILKRESGLPTKDEALYLGIASSALGERVVTGIDREWNVIWSHPLRRGVYRHQVDFPQAITIPGVGATWLIPGPDGAVHFLAADGKFQDVSYVGEHLRGIASVDIDDKPVLLLATDGKVVAYEVTKRESNQSTE